MNDLLKAFSRARRIFANPTKGIEYNKLISNRGVSREIYAVDLARNPQIVGDNVGNGFRFLDVQAEARFINSERDRLDSLARKVKGRSI